MPASAVCNSCKNTLTLNNREAQRSTGKSQCSGENLSAPSSSVLPVPPVVKIFQPNADRSELSSPQPRTIFRRTYIVIVFLLWCFLFIACWPLALLALIIYPIVWLLLLPFRLVGIAVHGALALVWAAVMLPARLLSAPFRLSRI
jgi:hypothetical protein